MDRLDEETRQIYYSALEIKRSSYWQKIVTDLDKRVFAALIACKDAVQEGDFKNARKYAAKYAAFEWLVEQIERPIRDAEQMTADQPEESYV